MSLLNHQFLIFTSNYIEVISKILKKLRIEFDGLGFKISLDSFSNTSVDERIRKLEVAKNNLLEGLSAINELQNQAEQNKKEVTIALTQLSELKKDKASLETEVNNIKNVIDSDVESFRKIAGIPSAKDIRKERIVGFISGVIASIIASLLIWGIVELYKSIFK